jgi:octaprenyl-diphosphate synthase
LEIITGKTAALLGCCCRLGAHYAGASEEIEEAATRYGLQLGIAFQIADDLLDMLGDEAAVGKSLGTDLLKQKSTLPLIRLLDQMAPPERAKLLTQLSASDNHRRTLLRPWWDSSDAIAYSQRKAREFSGLATLELDLLPPSPARDSLSGLAEFVVNRQH